MLEIVDEQGNVVGKATREEIHQKGLLHREIHVWLYTPQGEIIFQHRAKDKETFPDMLDATVGGHVEPGDSFEATALKEMEEETGIKAKAEDLRLVKIVRSDYSDPATNKRNNTIRKVFAYKYVGDKNGLKIEKGKSEGFEFWPIEKLAKASPNDATRFIPSFLNQEHIEMYKSFLAL